jgi:hypothetical protein
MSIRTMKNGEIHPDAVASQRLFLMPPSVIALAIVFSRHALSSPILFSYISLTLSASIATTTRSLRSFARLIRTTASPPLRRSTTRGRRSRTKTSSRRRGTSTPDGS